MFQEETRLSDLNLAGHMTRNKQMDVPINSYSSSDDDDFYDAFETSNQSSKYEYDLLFGCADLSR